MQQNMPYLQSNYDNGDKPVIVCVVCMWAALIDATQSVYVNVCVCVCVCICCLSANMSRACLNGAVFKPCKH